MALGTGLVAVRDPHAAGSWGVCPFLALTGLPCPLCGGLRAVHDLTHGDVAAALGSNALVVLLAPALLGWLLLWTARSWRADPSGPDQGRVGTGPTGGAAAVPRLGKTALVVLAAVAVAFTALRWLPALAWFAP